MKIEYTCKICKQVNTFDPEEYVPGYSPDQKAFDEFFKFLICNDCSEKRKRGTGKTNFRMGV